MKFYKDADGLFILDNDIVVPQRVYKLIFSADNTNIALYYDNEILINGLITDLQKENGVSYVDRADFLDGVGDFFVDASSLGGLTETYIPKMGLSQLEDSCLHETETELISSKTLVTPPGSIYIGRNAKISNALRALNLSDEILNRTGLLMAQIYDENGSKPAFVYNFNEEVEITVNESVAENSDYTIFERIPVENELVNSMKIKTSNISQIIPVIINIRIGSASGALVYEIDESVLTDENGMANIILGNPLVVDGGFSLFMEFTIPNMYGNTQGGVFIPNYTPKVHILERDDIAVKNDLKKPFIHIHREIELPILNDTLLEFDGIETNRDIEYYNGVFTFSKSGIYQVDFFCYVYVLATTDFNVWVEHSLDNGVTWNNNEHMVKMRLKSDGNNSIPLASVFMVDENEQYRIKLKSSAASTKLETQSLTNILGTIYQYAADLAIVKVSEI